MRTPHSPPLPSQAQRARRFWVTMLGGGLVAVVLLVTVLLFLFRREFLSLANVSLATQSVRTFLLETVPDLERRFPFDPRFPPALDPPLFARYCRARSAMAVHAATIMVDMRRIGEHVTSAAGQEREVLSSLGPAARKVRILAESVEGVLAAQEMSFGLYRWITLHTWAEVARAAETGDRQAREVLSSLPQDLLEAMDVPAFDGSSANRAGGLREWLAQWDGSQGDLPAWEAMREGWDGWAGVRGGPELDLLLIGFWDAIEEEFGSGRRE